MILSGNCYEGAVPFHFGAKTWRRTCCLQGMKIWRDRGKHDLCDLWLPLSPSFSLTVGLLNTFLFSWSRDFSGSLYERACIVGHVYHHILQCHRALVWVFILKLALLYLYIHDWWCSRRYGWAAQELFLSIQGFWVDLWTDMDFIWNCNFLFHFETLF